MSKIKHQLGVALITVMLIVALGAIIAAQMLKSIQFELQKADNIAFNQQAFWYALGAESLAKRVLEEDFKDSPNVTHLEQLWANGENTYPVDFGQITGEIVDLHACFNLNALKQPNSNEDGTSEKSMPRKAFEELVVALDIENVGNFEAEYLSDALADWLDDDTTLISAGGAEDNDYAAKEFPYYAANSFIADVSELRIVEHFDKQIIDKLKPYVCVIPQSDVLNININTISADQPELLQALLSISKDEAQEALSAREQKGFENVSDFFNLPEVNKHQITDDQKQLFVVDSQYFKLKASAKFNDSYFNLLSTLYVDKNNKVTVVGRKIGRD